MSGGWRARSHQVSRPKPALERQTGLVQHSPGRQRGLETQPEHSQRIRVEGADPHVPGIACKQNLPAIGSQTNIPSRRARHRIFLETPELNAGGPGVP